jgi:hypothetical protein
MNMILRSHIRYKAIKVQRSQIQRLRNLRIMQNQSTYPRKKKSNQPRITKRQNRVKI